MIRLVFAYRISQNDFNGLKTGCPIGFSSVEDMAGEQSNSRTGRKIKSSKKFRSRAFSVRLHRSYLRDEKFLQSRIMSRGMKISGILRKSRSK